MYDWGKIKIEQFLSDSLKNNYKINHEKKKIAKMSIKGKFVKIESNLNII